MYKKSKGNEEFTAEEPLDLMIPYTIIDQGQEAEEEYKTMAEKGMKECSLLAAAHSSAMESNGCHNYLIGSWLEEVLQ